MSRWRSSSSRALGHAIALVLFCQSCSETPESTCESQGNCGPDEVRPAADANASDAKGPSGRDGGPRSDGGTRRDAGTDPAPTPTDAAVPGDGEAPDSGSTFDASPAGDASPAQDAAPPNLDAAPPIVDAAPPIVDAHLPDPDAEPPDPDPYCYSPRQNGLRARDKGAYGCPCRMTRPNKSGYCVPSEEGHWNGMALVCWQERWLVVDDGPCLPPPTITHAQCIERGGELVVPVDSDASYVITCPNGRQAIGRLTTESGFVVQMPCCKK